jgi:hypothetical protein
MEEGMLWRAGVMEGPYVVARGKDINRGGGPRGPQAPAPPVRPREGAFTFTTRAFFRTAEACLSAVFRFLFSASPRPCKQGNLPWHASPCNEQRFCPGVRRNGGSPF